MTHSIEIEFRFEINDKTTRRGIVKKNMHRNVNLPYFIICLKNWLTKGVIVFGGKRPARNTNSQVLSSVVKKLFVGSKVLYFSLALRTL